MLEKALQYLASGDVWLWRDSAGNGLGLCQCKRRAEGVEFHLHDAEREDWSTVMACDKQLAESRFVRIEGRTFLAIPFDCWQLYVASLISVKAPAGVIPEVEPPPVSSI